MAESGFPSDWLRGALEVCVLRAIADGPTYGYAIAERLATLGGSPSGCSRDVARNTTLKPYPHGIASERKHVDALAASLALLATKYREAIDHTDQAGDAVTSDLFTRLTGDLDKNIWFIESHNA